MTNQHDATQHFLHKISKATNIKLAPANHPTRKGKYLTINIGLSHNVFFVGTDENGQLIVEDNLSTAG